MTVSKNATDIRLLLGGDLMLGRGVDQVLPFSCDQLLFEGWRGIESARTFVELAERRNGPLPAERGAAFVWGDLLAEFTDPAVDLRLVNLETALTTSAVPWPGKKIHYRCHPGNVATLQAAGLECCALANNHVLDWGYEGLRETISTLQAAGIACPGAGRFRQEADRPAWVALPGKGRVAIFSFAAAASGVPAAWAARPDRPGVSLVVLTEPFLEYISALVARVRREAALVVVSIHWGGNWGYVIPPRMRWFARQLVECGVDLVHGHSSHHVHGIEVYRDRLILYGAGDLLNDYEGLFLHPGPGRQRRLALHRNFRPDLGLLYRVRFGAAGQVREVAMVPTHIRGLRLTRADEREARWLGGIVGWLGRQLGCGCVVEDKLLRLQW